ncbi:PAS domain-containing protein, partial [bacterium]|nr:PAS domain-containing protein [bacterium]
ESEERLKLAVTATRSGIWDADLRLETCWWSPEFVDMLGYSPEEMPLRIGVWEDMIHPDDRGWTLALVARFISGEAPEYQPVYRLQRKDGSWIWIEAP